MKPAPARNQTWGGDHAGPRHVAIIMDGNGRWAKRRFLPRIMGHRKGVEAVRGIVEAAPDLGIEVLTLYAFSSENWKRPADEVTDLMGLLNEFLRKEIEELHAQGVRLTVIGDYRRLAPDLVALLDEGMELTRDNRRLTLALALNYGAQDEILRAVRSLASEVEAGRLKAADIDVGDMEAHLDTRDIPPPDLIIRTSGEVRLSNFLLWQAAYAELLFVDTLWPDFNADTLAQAVESFSGRSRRYGAL